jgi:predicted  nucleic acid-binding Zn ribbon protein
MHKCPKCKATTQAVLGIVRIKVGDNILETKTNIQACPKCRHNWAQFDVLVQPLDFVIDKADIHRLAAQGNA